MNWNKLSIKSLNSLTTFKGIDSYYKIRNPLQLEMLQILIN